MPLIDLQHRLEKAISQLPGDLRRDYGEAEKMLVERMRANVPVKTGRLRNSIRFEPDTTLSGSMIGGEFVAGGPEAPYAVEVHERPPTHVQEDTQEGGRTSKFISRVLSFHVPKIRPKFTATVRKHLTGEQV